MLTVLDLFSGIGGFSLGLERTGGFKTVAFCEIDPFCRDVLAKHWPGVPCYEDVRMIDGAQYRGQVDVVTGGVPCQPASVAGKRKGVNDDRWLWPHFLSVVRAVQPVWVLAENPLGIVSLKPHGLAWIVGELEAEGYETQCLVIGADDVGAPHRRKRVWIVGRLVNTSRAGISRQQHRRLGSGGKTAYQREADYNGADRSSAKREGVADAEIGGLGTDWSAPRDSGHVDIGRADVADSESIRQRESNNETGTKPRQWARKGASRGSATRMWPSRPGEPQHEWEAPRLAQFGVGASANGLPERLVRFGNKCALRAAGNSVVPQVVEIIGQAILAKAAKANRK